jgi:hypothetical protein
LLFVIELWFMVGERAFVGVGGNAVVVEVVVVAVVVVVVVGVRRCRAVLEFGEGDDGVIITG